MAVSCVLRRGLHCRTGSSSARAAPSSSAWSLPTALRETSSVRPHSTRSTASFTQCRIRTIYILVLQIPWWKRSHMRQEERIYASNLTYQYDRLNFLSLAKTKMKLNHKHKKGKGYCKERVRQ